MLLVGKFFSMRLTSGMARNVSSSATATAATAAAAPKMAKKPDMFCNQCEQTYENKGCDTVGVCGKTPEVASLQDNLVYALKGLSSLVSQLQKPNEEIDAFVKQALFATMTNVNFDEKRFDSLLKQTESYLESVKKELGPAAVQSLTASNPHVSWKPEYDDLVKQGKKLRVHDQNIDPDIIGMQEMITYGLKGMCAYAEHARVLGEHSKEVDAFVHKTLRALTDKSKSLSDLIQIALDVGKMNVTVLDLLDGGHNKLFGMPTPTAVKTMPRPSKHAILMSGHDIKDLHSLLLASENKGIDVYTHGELLPAHGYPEIRKFKHLAGNYGGPWQLQKFEFSEFPGPIVMTTNCLIEPRKSYKDRIYTNSVVGFPGVKTINNNDFTPVINQALSLPGFDAADVDDLDRALHPDVTVGFGHGVVLSIADKILDAVKAGHIKRFVVMGGCDGSEGERSYFTEMAKQLPLDAVILTLGCGKYRFNKLPNMGTIPSLGIPRVLDLGQCNDAYSGVKVALGLANALKIKDLNDLPLNFVVSWFEQKAVAVFLTLLHLGVKNIYLGPRLPAFATPNILNFLVENYKVHPIGSVSDDLKQMGLTPRLRSSSTKQS